MKSIKMFLEPETAKQLLSMLEENNWLDLMTAIKGIFWNNSVILEITLKSF